MRIQQNQKTIQIIKTMRAENFSYGTIAEKLGISSNTVKSICRRSGFTVEDKPLKQKKDAADVYLCKNCGKTMSNPWNRKGKLFCSDSCRTSYWNEQKRLKYLEEREREEKERKDTPTEENWLTEIINMDFGDYRSRRHRGERAKKSGRKGPESAGLPGAREVSLDDKEVAP